MLNNDPIAIRPNAPELVNTFAALTADTADNKTSPNNTESTDVLECTAQAKSAGSPELTPTLSTFTATAQRYDRKQPLETPQQAANPLQDHTPHVPTLNTTQETPNNDQDPTKTKTSSGPTTLPSEKAGPLTLTIINETYYEITVRAEYSQNLSLNRPPHYPYFFDTIPARRNKKIEIPRHNPNPWFKKLTRITLFQGKELSGEDLDPVAIMTAKTLELTIYSQING